MNRCEVIGGVKAPPKLEGGLLRLQLIVSDVDADRVVNTFVSVEVVGSMARVLGDADLRPGDTLYVLGRLTQQVTTVAGETERKTRVRAHDVRVLSLVPRR